MRLATFNLESFGGERTGEPETLARLDVMRAALLSLRADVLCLQEVNGQRPTGGGDRSLADLALLLEGTPLSDHARISAGPGGAVGDRHNLVILSRFPVEAHRSLDHDLVPQSALRLPSQPDDPIPIAFDRPVLHATLRLPDGRPLEVFNAHLRAPLAAPVPGEKLGAHRWRSATGWAEGYYLAAMKQTAQALEIRRAIDLLLDADADRMIAVAGDLNADLFETPLRMLMAVAGDTETPELAGRALAAAEARVPQERRHTAIHAGRRQLLDHILTSQGLASCLADAGIENGALVDDAEVPEGFPGSLHAALWADFDL